MRVIAWASRVSQPDMRNSVLSAIFLEDMVRVVTITDGSMLSACPNSPSIDGRSALHPYEGCTVSVSDSTPAGNGFLAVPGLLPVVGLDNGQCCDCSSNCVLDGCQVVGGGDINCCGVLGEHADLDDYLEFEMCLQGPTGGVESDCECYNLAPDDGLDLRDFAEFQRMFVGS